MEALPRMSLRRFLVLLRGLGPHSATVAHMNASSTLGRKREKVNEVTTPQAAQATFEMIFKNRKQRHS